MSQVECEKRPDFAATSLFSVEFIPNSGGSRGFGALGPAILRGPMQGCDPTFPSWGSGALQAPLRGPGRAPKPNASGNNILKIDWKSGTLVAVYTHNSDPISDTVVYGKSRYPSRLYESCHLLGNDSHIIITCSRLATAMYTLSLVYWLIPRRSHTFFLSLPNATLALESLLLNSTSMLASLERVLPR